MLRLLLLRLMGPADACVITMLRTTRRAAGGPRLWNTLPSTLRQMTSCGQFNRHLKTHLFRAWNHDAL